MEKITKTNQMAKTEKLNGKDNDFNSTENSNVDNDYDKKFTNENFYTHDTIKTQRQTEYEKKRI